jgi:hypothetical protein
MVLAHWNNSPRIDMSPHLNTLSQQVCAILVNTACLARTNTCQFYSLQYDPIGARANDLPHSRRGYEPLHHICGCFSRLLLSLVPWVTFTMNELIVCYFNMHLKKEQNNISWLFAILRKERKLEVKIRRGLFHILTCTLILTVSAG